MAHRLKSVLSKILIVSQHESIIISLLKPIMHLKEFFEDEHLYYILPNRIYFFLGAQASDTEGECEWYNLNAILFPESNQLYASRMQAVICTQPTGSNLEGCPS